MKEFISSKYPEWLARVEYSIAKGLSKERAATWPDEFLAAVPVGPDLNQIKKNFKIFILKQNLNSLNAATFDDVVNADVKENIDNSKAAVQDSINALVAEEAAPELKRPSVLDPKESTAKAASWSVDSSMASIISVMDDATIPRAIAESIQSLAASAASAAEDEVWSSDWSVPSVAAEEAHRAGSAARARAIEEAYGMYADTLLALLASAQ